MWVRTAASAADDEPGVGARRERSRRVRDTSPAEVRRLRGLLERVPDATIAPADRAQLLGLLSWGQKAGADASSGSGGAEAAGRPKVRPTLLPAAAEPDEPVQKL